jgi:hypothetical protein
MRKIRWRHAALPFAGAVGVAAVVLLGTGGAQAGAAPSGAPGNNGTVKIHDGDGEPSAEVRNEPHVCTFHVHAFFLDAGQVVTFEVLSWPPTGDRTSVLTGSITADADGVGRAPASGVYSLPDGHYKLDVDTGEGAPIKDKHKVFWVSCKPSPSESPTTSPATSPTSPGESPTSPVTPAESPTTTPAVSPTSPGESPTTLPAVSPTSPSESMPAATTLGGAPPTSQAAGAAPPPAGLPMTGSPVGLVVGLGLALLLAGTGVLLSPWGRRRLLGS